MYIYTYTVKNRGNSLLVARTQCIPLCSIFLLLLLLFHFIYFIYFARGDVGWFLEDHRPFFHSYAATSHHFSGQESGSSGMELVSTILGLEKWEFFRSFCLASSRFPLSRAAPSPIPSDARRDAIVGERGGEDDERVMRGKLCSAATEAEAADVVEGGGGRGKKRSVEEDSSVGSTAVVGWAAEEARRRGDVASCTASSRRLCRADAGRAIGEAGSLPSCGDTARVPSKWGAAASSSLSGRRRRTSCEGGGASATSTVWSPPLCSGFRLGRGEEAEGMMVVARRVADGKTAESGEDAAARPARGRDERR